MLVLFREEVVQNGELLDSFCKAILAADARKVEQLLTKYMGQTISVRDNFARSLHKNFYHGLMLGILGYQQNWEILSNRESGDGFSDIQIETKGMEESVGIVIELKYSSEEKNMEQDCREALQQIKDSDYDQELIILVYKKIFKYVIAFYDKM